MWDSFHWSIHWTSWFPLKHLLTSICFVRRDRSADFCILFWIGLYITSVCFRYDSSSIWVCGVRDISAIFSLSSSTVPNPGCDSWFRVFMHGYSFTGCYATLLFQVKLLASTYIICTGKKHKTIYKEKKSFFTKTSEQDLTVDSRDNLPFPKKTVIWIEPLCGFVYWKPRSILWRKLEFKVKTLLLYSIVYGYNSTFL